MQALKKTKSKSAKKRRIGKQILKKLKEKEKKKKKQSKIETIDDSEDDSGKINLIRLYLKFVLYAYTNKIHSISRYISKQ